MKLQFILLFTVLGCLVAASSGDQDASGQPKQEEEDGIRETEVKPSARANFVMPKLFDFELFMEKFDKHYANAAELARRMKLFTARAFAVFISGIKYKYGYNTKYLKINPFSDWTLEERKAISNHMIGRGGAKPSPDVPENNVDDPMPAVDAEDVQRVLAEISEHRDDDPNYAAIDAELKRVNHERKKRNANLESTSSEPKPRRDLSMEDLAAGGSASKATKVPAKYASWVPSNNPDYEKPEHDSQGVDDDEDQIIQPIPADEAKRIDDEANQGGYLNMLVASIRGAVDYLSSSSQLLQSETPKRTKYSSENADEHKHEQKSEVLGEKSDSLPDKVFLDYRKYGCFLEPKNQLRCGACYIFAITALMEFHHCIQRKKLVPFSEQYAVDCGYRMNDTDNMNGCEGGQMSTVGDFVAKYGLELLKDYPYTGKHKSCLYDPTTDATHMGHSKLEIVETVNLPVKNPLITPKAFEILLKTKGPLYVGLYHTAEYFDFAGGVDVPKCDSEGIGAHATVLIGHGREDGREYWLIRNSYGPEWGFEGHYKIAKESPKECFIDIGFVRGTFKRNKKHQGKELFNRMKIEAQLPEAHAAATT